MIGGMTTDERTDLINSLAKQRGFLGHTVKDLDDRQAARTTTVSTLCLGGLIKHVTEVEANWARFVVEGPGAVAPPADFSTYQNGFRMLPGETLRSLLDRYDEVAGATEKLIRTVPSLDDDQPLPEAPWFEPGARWSARTVFLHILAETAQHCGHADIIRESLDGAKTMG
jgi:hypothetical protein